MGDEARASDFRAQLLATEHWSLLASRSTTQGEVLTRISIFLTFVSAGLVSLALVGQVTDFDENFPVFAIVILAIVCLVGVLTQVRILNAGMDDAMYLIAMNRLRSAYLELEPSIAPYLMASPHDDLEGLARSYYFFGRRSELSQLIGSTMIFIIAVNSSMIGLLAAAIATASGASLVWCIVIGAVAAVAFSGGSVAHGQRNFLSVWKHYEPKFPSPRSAA
jgi:hypothetical protein